MGRGEEGRRAAEEQGKLFHSNHHFAGAGGADSSGGVWPGGTERGGFMGQAPLLSLASDGFISYPSSHSFCPGEEHVPTPGEVSYCVYRHFCVPVCRRMPACLVCVLGGTGGVYGWCPIYQIRAFILVLQIEIDMKTLLCGGLGLPRLKPWRFPVSPGLGVHGPGPGPARSLMAEVPSLLTASGMGGGLGARIPQHNLHSFVFPAMSGVCGEGAGRGAGL